MEVWTDKMNWTLFIRFSSETSSSSSSPAPRLTDLHPPWTLSFSVRSQRSHLPPQSWILLLLHLCLQPYQEMLGPPPPSPPPPPPPPPPVCLSPAGEETAGETEPEPGCWSRWCQPQSPEHLCGPAMWILQQLFNLSLSQEKVLVLWKTSCLDPGPKRSHPSK